MLYVVTPTPNLRALTSAVERAKAERDRPFEEGEESRQIFPLVEYLDERGERAAWNAVQLVRQHEQALYNRFIGERYLRDLVVDLVAEHDGEIDFAELAEQLKQTADRANAWL